MIIDFINHHELITKIIFFLLSLLAGLYIHFKQLSSGPFGYRQLLYQAEINKKVMQVLLKRKDPCERIARDFKYIFRSPKRLEIISRIDKYSKCFKREEFYLQALEAAFENEPDATIPAFFYPLTLKNYSHLLPNLFKECCKHGHYECVTEILKGNIKANYHGQNILHLAAKYDDITLAQLVKDQRAYLLHLRDSTGRIPPNYVISEEMLNVINARLDNEEKKSPFLREIQTHITRVYYKISRSQFTASWPYYPSSRSGGDVITLNRQLLLMTSYLISKNYDFRWYTPDLYHFHVRFKNENAIDQSGVTNEWLSLLLESFFKPNPAGQANKYTAPLFEPTDENSNIYVPTNLYTTAVYKFAGSIVAIAAGRGIPMGFELIPSFYRILYAINPVRSDDLEAVIPQMYKNLMLLAQQTPEAIEARKLLDLSRKNVKKYTQERTADVLFDRYADSLNAFAHGFKSKLRFSLISFFDPFELKEWLKGEQTLTFAQISDILVCDILHPFKAAQFKRVLSRFSTENLRKFLKFITGRNSLPSNGLAELGIKIYVYFYSFKHGHLPTASTCFNKLHIYHFESEEELEKQLLYAIENCQTLENH